MPNNFKITVLGCGTSTGVPVIGCHCPVCKSNNPKNNRLRSSILIQHNNQNIIIDTSVDFRFQALKFNIENVHAALFTHHHADHIHGIDELRVFMNRHKSRLPCYGRKETLSNIKKIYFYAFDEKIQTGGGIPKIELIEVQDPFHVSGIKITPFDVYHGKMTITGYRFFDVAYITDSSKVPDASKKILNNLELLFINALRETPHPTHFSIPEALSVIEELKPERAILIHLGHNIDFETTQKNLPENVSLAYDGLELPF